MSIPRKIIIRTNKRERNALKKARNKKKSFLNKSRREKERKKNIYIYTYILRILNNFRIF